MMKLFIALLCLLPGVCSAYSYTGTKAVTNAPRVLFAMNSAVTHTGTVNETTIWTGTIPAGAMGKNGTLRITALVSFPASANTKTIKLKFGGTTFLSHSPLTGSYQSLQFQKCISNRNSASSQIGSNLYDSADISWSTNVVVTSSINTAVDQPLIITAQLGNTGETITLQRVIVEILPGLN